MKNLFEPEAVLEVKHRMNTLRAESPALWGKMNSAQALAHCSIVMKMAQGESSPQRLFIGRLIGPFFKSIYSNEKPMQRGAPTHPSFIVGEPCDLEKERERLGALMDRFSAAGEEGCTRHPHPFFGHMTPREWSIGMYKHLDHHLRQFGV